PDVDPLLPDLRHAAGDVVLDLRRVHPGALHERLQHGGEQIDGMGTGQRALPFADRAADGLDDDCLGHGQSPSGWGSTTYRTVTNVRRAMFPLVRSSILAVRAWRGLRERRTLAVAALRERIGRAGGPGEVELPGQVAGSLVPGCGQVSDLPVVLDELH